MNGYYLQIVEDQLSKYLPDLVIRKIIRYIIEENKNVYVAMYNHTWNCVWSMRDMNIAIRNVYKNMRDELYYNAIKHLEYYAQMKDYHKPMYKDMVLAEYKDIACMEKEGEYFGQTIPKEVYKICMGFITKKLKKTKTEYRVWKHHCSVGISAMAKPLHHEKNYIEWNRSEIDESKYNKYELPDGSTMINMWDLHKQRRGLKNVYSRDKLYIHCKRLGMNAQNRKNFNRSKKNQYIDWILEMNDWKIYRYKSSPYIIEN